MTHSLKSSYKEPSEQLRNGNRTLNISRISLGNWLLTRKHPLSSHAQFFLFFCEDIVITHAADLKLNSSLDFFFSEPGLLEVKYTWLGLALAI